MSNWNFVLRTSLNEQPRYYQGEGEAVSDAFTVLDKGISHRFSEDGYFAQNKGSVDRKE